MKFNYLQAESSISQFILHTPFTEFELETGPISHPIWHSTFVSPKSTWAVKFQDFRSNAASFAIYYFKFTINISLIKKRWLESCQSWELLNLRSSSLIFVILKKNLKRSKFLKLLTVSVVEIYRFLDVNKICKKWKV